MPEGRRLGHGLVQTDGLLLVLAIYEVEVVLQPCDGGLQGLNILLSQRQEWNIQGL